jgi:regulation of enolase protein 1 (concanavalin A-like superfamily)
MAVLFSVVCAMVLRAAPEPQIGGTFRIGTAYDISVIFSEPVDVSSLSNPENYAVFPGELASLRLCATNLGVVLTVTGLSPGAQGFVQVSNIEDSAGNPVPSANLDFTAGDRLWAVIGENELGFPPDAVAFPEDGFDIFSGGVQQRDEYDDATFVGEEVTGDFEAKVRVESVEPAGAGAKAGIMIREKLDEGKPRPVNPDDPAQAFSRYVELAISAPESVLGEPGAGHQIWQRAMSPSLDTFPVLVTNDAAPAFPKAWLRVERVGPMVLMSRSVDGSFWERLGSATFDPPLSTNVWVGLAFTPQNGDIPAATELRRSFVAKFRQYQLIPKPSANLKIERIGDHAEVTWDAGWILETAKSVTGQWTQAPSQQTPLRVDFTEPMRFFRLRRVSAMINL